MLADRSWIHSHPLRDRLLFEYQGEPTSPSELARRIGEPLNLVSYHTQVLVRSGWLELVATEQRRGGTAHLYRATAAAFIDGDEWLGVAPPARRALVRGLLASVSDEAHRAALHGAFDPGHAHLTRRTVVLDDEGAAEVGQVLRRLIDDLSRIQAESTARASPSRRRARVVLMGFRAAAAPRRS